MISMFLIYKENKPSTNFEYYFSESSIIMTSESNLIEVLIEAQMYLYRFGGPILIGVVAYLI
jgi:hypothetical protein